MAYYTDTAPRPSFFEGFGKWLEKIGTARYGAHRLEKMEKLCAMSDAELAELGIRRQDIPRVVFGNMLYL